MARTARNNYNEEVYLVTLQDEIAGNNVSEHREEAFAIDNGLFSKVAPLFYKNRLRLTFFVSDEYRSRYALLRGIIEFHRPKAFTFLYNRTDKILECDITVHQANALHEFLGSVLQLIECEVKFKEVLKQVIDFEDQCKRISGSVYGSLMRSAAVH
jgi:hypothetical protein